MPFCRAKLTNTKNKKNPSEKDKGGTESKPEKREKKESKKKKAKENRGKRRNPRKILRYQFCSFYGFQVSFSKFLLFPFKKKRKTCRGEERVVNTVNMGTIPYGNLPGN